MNITITVDQRSLQECLKGLDPIDARKGLEEAAAFMVTATGRNILSETSPDGTPFAPLSPAYAKRKKGPGILRETEDMFKATRIASVDEDSAIIENDDFKAPFHQFGVRQGSGPRDGRPSAGSRGGIPARPFMGFGESDADACAAIVARKLFQ